MTVGLPKHFLRLSMRHNLEGGLRHSASGSTGTMTWTTMPRSARVRDLILRRIPDLSAGIETIVIVSQGQFAQVTP